MRRGSRNTDRCDEAAADLEELIQLNPKRPYFLLMHVGESHTVEKISTIINGLSQPVEVVPLDVFLKLAASAKPTARATRNHRIRSI